MNKQAIVFFDLSGEVTMVTGCDYCIGIAENTVLTDAGLKLILIGFF